MILYVRVNGSDHTMTMLQIPRDTLVGEIGGSAGKINGIFANSADKENRVNTLAQYITKVFGLPIDDYVTIDMDSLREIVDVFGGIEVYVPVTMEYDGSRLEQMCIRDSSSSSSPTAAAPWKRPTCCTV